MRKILFVVWVALPPVCAHGLTGDASAGKQKSNTCVACHGPNGVSSNSFWPNLAAQKEDYLIKQIKAFRDGQRSDPLMSPVSKMLSDQDAADLSAYYTHLGAAP